MVEKFIPVAIPPQLDSFACTLNVPDGFQGSTAPIGTYPTAEVTVSTVDGGCQIAWDNAARNLKDKMPVPVRITAAPFEGATHRTDLDIILELVDKTTAPTVTATFGGSAIAETDLIKFTLDTANTVTFTITDPDVGATVYVASATIPSSYGATLAPRGPPASSLSPVLTYTPTSGHPKTGVIQVIAFDNTNLQGTFSFQYTIDNTPPVIAVPGTLTLEASGPSGAVGDFVVTATDDVDVSVTPTCDYDSGATFPVGLPVGTTTVSCTATDRAGNTGTASFQVIVQDTKAPKIVGTPADISVTGTNAAGAVVTYTPPTASDLVDGPVGVTCTPASGTVFGYTPTTVTCTATDAHTNTATTTFQVTVAQCAFVGFRPPLSSSPDAVQTVTATQTVPVKWSVGGDYGMILASGPLLTPYLTRVDCTSWSSAGVDQTGVPAPTDMSSLLQYDPTSTQYQLNYQLKGKVFGGKCYTLTFIFNICPTVKHVIKLSVK
ncbi:hypothetical protein HXX76_014886 [Chlamydomonas incerta]|uniref:HYR domain-containing protein n=1 Tax=Chlamydomonas incerta TaxID=51695 RepID=A0A835SNK0_CHLIN|nr:hypothetical protein HXX76_014886 [Chlamydomonas incerta]|eukprot:KAG2423945.1 hypothetical protein HXX76_014886 [Chlamydomonas incerta]